MPVQVVGIHAPSYLRLFRATTNKNINTPLDASPYGLASNWTHNAIVWSADPAGLSCSHVRRQRLFAQARSSLPTVT